MPSEAINVLRFRAGDHPCAVAAGAVRDFRPSHPATKHVAGLLGTTPAASSDDRRDVVLACGGRSFRIAVDGPVELVQLQACDLLAAPRALAAVMQPVMAFARLTGDPRLILLLDVVLLTQQIDTTRDMGTRNERPAPTLGSIAK